MELLIKRSIQPLFVLFVALHTFLSAALSQRDLDAIRPHQLAQDHPASIHLDHLFKKGRFIRNVDKLKDAGFECSGPRKHTGLIVAKHPKTPGVIYKIYTDAQEFYKNVPEYYLWLMRIEGVRRIREYLDQRQWNDQFKTPRKWIYVIPSRFQPHDGYYMKHTILVEDDMDLLSNKENLQKWKGDTVSEQLLERVFHIITDLGLRDCAKPDNIPFSKDGKIAFIDTQTDDEPPVPHKRLTSHLSKSNQRFWKKLIKCHNKD